MIRVECAVPVYEVGGQTGPFGTTHTPVTVISHSIRREFVVLEIEGKRYTVNGSDLRAAIENAQNTGGFS